MEVQQRAHMHCAGFACGLRERGVLRRVFLRRLPLRHAPTGGQVAVDDVVRRGLVGDDVRARATGFGTARQLGQQLGGVAAQANRYRFFARGVVGNQRQRFV